MKPSIRLHGKSTIIASGTSWLSFAEAIGGRLAIRGRDVLGAFRERLGLALLPCEPGDERSLGIVTHAGPVRLLRRGQMVTIAACGYSYDVELEFARILNSWLCFLTGEDSDSYDDLGCFAPLQGGRAVVLACSAKPGRAAVRAGVPQNLQARLEPVDVDLLVRVLLRCAEDAAGVTHVATTAASRIALSPSGATGYRLKLLDTGSAAAEWWLTRPSLVRLALALRAAAAVPGRPDGRPIRHTLQTS